jgi:hypothetical protein
MPSRRTFLVTGTLGAATLATAGGIAWMRRAAAPPPPSLDDDARAILAAIVPAMLAGALPTTLSARDEAITATVTGVERAIAGLPPASRKELGELFALLAFAPARRALAGVASPWAQASVAEVDAFLTAWRGSRWALKRSAYDAFHQLIIAAWYANPRSWPAIGYPGPPVLVA